MNLLVYDPETGAVLSMGVVAPECALPDEKLPAGSVYVDSFPTGKWSDWRYIDGAFVPAEGSDNA